MPMSGLIVSGAPSQSFDVSGSANFCHANNASWLLIIAY